ncbi:hypothetical protein VUR80DRAFT_6549 [Thermomyces stellatus]
MALAIFVSGAAIFAPGILAHSKGDYDHMGALGVMWPPDREWSENDAREAPCGNVDGVVNRTEFPLSGAFLEFEQTDVVYDLEVYVSLDESDPESNEDFERISPEPIPSLDFAHVCIPAPNLPTASPDQNATLQFRYVAAYHSHKRHPSTNETFYLCSDITLVSPTFVAQDEMPCFNISSDELDGHTHDGHTQGHSGQEDGGEDLSGGAIAGIVVGSVAGLAIIAGAAWFLWRRAASEEESKRQIDEADEKLRDLGSRRGSGQGSEGSASAV